MRKITIEDLILTPNNPNTTNNNISIFETPPDNHSNHSTNSNISKIQIPFFEEGVGLVKFFNKGKYFIVGNKNSQMFYIYEMYPQTNLKFPHENSNYRILYSLYRGVTSAFINTVEISSCRNYCVIGSNKGTFHFFELPKKDNQIFENSSDFDYQNFDEVNQKVTNAKNLDKIKLGNFLGNYIYKSSSKILKTNKLDIDKFFSDDMKENLLKSKFTKFINATILFTFTENDPCIRLFYIHKKSKKIDINSNINSHIYSLKKIELENFLNEEKDLIEKNYQDLSANRSKIYFINKMKSFKDFIELETTDRNFPDLHINPLFTFNLIHKYPMSRSSNTNINNVNIKQNTNSNKKSINLKLYPTIEEKNENDISPSTSSNFFSKKSNLLKIENVSCVFISPSNCNRMRPHTNSVSLPSTNYHQMFIIKNRRDSVNVRVKNSYDFYNYINSANNANNNSINDNLISERVLCQEIEYVPKIFNLEKRVLPRSDFANDNYLYPKLIVHPVKINYQNFYNNKAKKNFNYHKINSSLSDHSSSKDNSISLIISNTDELNQNSNNMYPFFKNKETHLETQLKNAIETNMVDNLKNVNTEVKRCSDFNIDENYYNK